MKVTNNPLFEETLNNKKYLLNLVNSLNANVFTPKNKANFRARVESNKSNKIKTRNNLARASEQLHQKRFNAQIESSRVVAEEKLRLIRESEQAQEKAEQNKKNENEREKDELKQKYENTVNKITTNIIARGELKRLFNTFYTKNTIPPVNVQKFIHEERQRLGILSNQEKALPLVNTLKNLRNFLNENPNYSNDEAIVKKFKNIAKLITSAPRYKKTPNQREKLDQLSSKLSANTKNKVKTAINKYLGST